ncbi:unnamed protein product [Choristocarpus tenellus]
MYIKCDPSNPRKALMCIFFGLQVAMEGAIRYSDASRNTVKYIRPWIDHYGSVQSRWLVSPKEKKRRTVVLHNIVYRTWGRWIPEYQSSYWRVVHINGDKQNNRMTNLEMRSVEEIYRMQEPDQKLHAVKASGIAGVVWDEAKEKWKVKGRADRKDIHLGYFDKVSEAERVLDEFKSIRKFYLVKALEQTKREPGPEDSENVSID